MRCAKMIIGSLFLCAVLCVPAFADLIINLVAVNPSDEAKTITVTQKLPQELDLSDILDSGPLKIKFDVNKNFLYAYEDIDFSPKESRTFQIRVNDVWMIDPVEIENLKTQLDITLEILKDDENYQSALYVRDQLIEKMDFILKRQEEFSGNIGRRIEEYRANVKLLQTIRNEIYSQDFLKFESKAIEESDQNKKTIRMTIEVTNPSSTESKTVTHKHFLPKEVRADTIVDKKDFELRYDDEKQQPYLSKEEEFAPGETKTYDIVLEDIWEFPDIKLQDLDSRAEISTLELEGTNYAESAKNLLEGIAQNIKAIRDSRELDTSAERHIGLFRLNSRRYEEAYQDFKRIEEMIAIVRAKKLRDMEQKKVKNVLERLKALRGLKQISEALFKRKLSMNVTWKIILGVLGFIALFTTLHFVIWARRSKVMGEGLGPDGGEGIKVVPKPGGESQEEE